MVIGNNFVSQSQIFWNGNALLTVFVDSQHLETTVTQQVFQQFGGSPGNSVVISVNSAVTSPVVGCPIGGSSATLVLTIN
jgi:ABC-type Fe3+ transport system permease subunit